MTAPVVLISFNRPEVTRRNLQAIREAAPAELLLIADGPRHGNDDDKANCAAVRAELETIDWPCEVHRRYADVNLGINENIESGLDWVFEQVHEAIVLEDDCLPNADFFRFCTELLERYRTTDEVWQITGRAPTVPAKMFAGASYAFVALAPIWGWATWRHAWTAHRAHLARRREAAEGLDLSESRLLTRAGRRYFADVAKNRERDAFAWDSQWSLSMVAAGGLAAMPSANLIEMTGFGADATNTTEEIGDQRSREPIDWPLSHPAELEVNRGIERLLERIAAVFHGRAARFLSRRLADGRIRRAARAAAGAWRERQMRVP